MANHRALNCLGCSVPKTIENTHTVGTLADGTPKFKSFCKECSVAGVAAWRKANPEKWAKLNVQYVIRRREKNKKLVFDHYGWVCACCGETMPEFLQIDHVDGGGSAHRKACGNSLERIYHDIIVKDFPDTYRILCANCNWSRGVRGYCPHRPDEKQQSRKAA